jgi:hypothetical protein
MPNAPATLARRCAVGSLKGNPHAAPWAKPRTRIYRVSQRPQLPVSDVARGGQYESLRFVPVSRAGTPALKTAGQDQYASAESVNRAELGGFRNASGRGSRCDSRVRPAGEMAQPGSARVAPEVAGSNPALTASQYRIGEVTVGGGYSVAPLTRFDTNVLPAARSCGAKASDRPDFGDTASAACGRVVRLTAGTPIFGAPHAYT